MKKFLALVLTMTMVLSMGVSASATELTDEGAATTVTASVESNLYGSANTQGNSTLKAELGVEVEYDEDSAAVITLTTSDGSPIDDSLIDISEAYVTLDAGDGYYVSSLEFNGTALTGEFVNGQLSYHLNTGDIEWKQPDGYYVDNGGMEWSALGGNGNGEYTFNLSVHGIKYDGVEVEAASFRAYVYIYGRQFSSTTSPTGGSSSRWGAGGYDSVELPLPEEKTLEETVTVGTDPVWTWVGDSTYDMPILCDYSYYYDVENEDGESVTEFYDATDNFYITWPDGVDASELTADDVTITLYSQYGDEYVLTPNTGLRYIEEADESIANGEYSVFAGESTTQIAVNMVYWAAAPVYTTMTIEVASDATGTVSQTYDIGSVYTYYVQTGGGLDYEGTVTIQQVYGVANIDELDIDDVANVTVTSYTYAYTSGRTALAWLIFNEDGTITVTEDKDEATTFESDMDPEKVSYMICRTGHTEPTYTAEYNGEEVTFSRSYDGSVSLKTIDLDDTALVAASGYVLCQSSSWEDHQRWGWLYFNNVGWTETEEDEDEATYDTGLYKIDGEWYYYVDGVWQSDYTGLVKYTNGSGSWWYVVDGKINFNYTGLVKYTTGSWYYVVNGKVDYSDTGLVKQSTGSWWYVVNGSMQSRYNGFVKHTSGSWYLVQNGRAMTNYTGLAKHTTGTWYYAENGKINFNFTGIVAYSNGKSYYVVDGRIARNYTGTVNGQKVVKGIVVA